VPSPAQRRDALVTAELIVVNFVVVLGLCIVAVLNVGNRSVFLAVAVPLSVYALCTGGNADASVAPCVRTLDRRHFSVVRPAHTSAFELVP
jgi:hypothetical protein